MEGLAEPLSDLLLDCTGGAPGGVVPTTLSLNLNTGLTSKVEGGLPEALVLIDDPAPGSQTVGLNVFQASSGGGSQVTFNLTFTAPGSGHRILRIVNLRANASGLGLSPTLIPTQIVAFVSASGGSININQPQQTVGFIQAGMVSRIRTLANTFSGGLSFPQCTGLNSDLANSPSAPGGSLSFNAQFLEGFPAAFKKRNISSDPLTPSAQNTPGYFYGTESMYFDPSFSTANALNTAGRASQGTRVALHFDNVPRGVAIYVTTTPSSFGTTPTIGANGARLVQTDANGAGDYVPVAATTTASVSGTSMQIAPVTLVSGSGMAVWEILNSDPTVTESLSFGVLVAYQAGVPLFGTANMRAGFAPTSSVTSNASTMVPRFNSFPFLTPNNFAISQCGVPLPDLIMPSLSASPTAAASSSVAFTSMIQNQGGASTSSSTAAIGLYSDAALTSRVYSAPLVTCSFGPIPASSSASCNGNIFIPSSLAPGSYYLGALVDDQGYIPESDETNNTYALPITITSVPCTYNLSSAGTVSLPFYSTFPFSLTAGAGCPWSVSSDSSWLTLVGSQSGSGSASLMAAATANTGNTRVGQLTIAGKTFKVTQAAAVNTAPVLLPTTPASGSGAIQTFTFSASDANGVADLASLQVVIGAGTSTSNACAFTYFVGFGGGGTGFPSQILLLDDAGSATASILPGTTGSIENSQCVLSAPTVLASGNTLSLTVSIGFKPASTGPKTVYVNASDIGSSSTGLQSTGSWTVPGISNFPAVVSGTPLSSSVTPQTFTFTGRDADGYADIYRMYFLVNPTPNIPANSCHGFYDRGANALYLYNDNLTALSGPLTPGTAGTLQNSQCVINGSTSSLVSASGTDVTINLGLGLQGAYAGTSQNVYLWVKDNENQDTGWVQTGTWNLTVAPNLPPLVVSGTPAGSTVSPQTFAFTGRDPNGYADIYRMYFLVNPTPNIPANSCHGFYDRAGNALYLYNDTLTALSGPLTPGSAGTLQNGQCVINGSTSALISASGTDLTISLGLGLQGPYAGTNQKVYLWVKDTQNHDTGWVQTSTWSLAVANLPPSAPPAVPTFSTMNPQSFYLTGRDPDGYGDIYRMYFLINPTPNIPANSCHGFYDRAANAIYLYNDTLTALLGPLTPGSAGTLQNSQCVVDGSTSWLVSASGTDLTIRLGLRLQGSYAGTSQRLYLWVKDSQNHDTGWVQAATWNLTPAANLPPSVVSGTPAIATANPQLFTFTGRDPDGFGDIYRMYFLINPTPNIPANSCHGFYDRAANGFYLYNDSLTAISGPLTPGSSGTLQNSQCIINGSGSYAIGMGMPLTDLMLGLSVQLQGSYAGTNQKVYLWVKDSQNHDTGWVQTSTWNLGPVANQAPTVVSGSPSISSVTPQTFTFTGRDPDGYSDIYRMYFLINPTPDIPANSCHGFYDRAANAFYLYNDTLTALSGPLTPGTAGTLQNSQCSINGSTSSLVSASGTDLTLNLGLAVQGSYAGTSQKVYLWVKDTQNHDTGWVQTGTWTPH